MHFLMYFSTRMTHFNRSSCIHKTMLTKNVHEGSEVIYHKAPNLLSYREDSKLLELTM